MCGLVGVYSANGAAPPTAALAPALEHSAHRGPDAEGVFGDEWVALGHRRLAILDLDARSTQPFFSEDGRHVLVYNGEIYNYLELREELVQQGVSFRTTSDTEVLLQLLIRDGVDCLKRLQGAFAFAWWRRDARRLVLARDRFGEKPLQYCWREGRLAFASEFRALFRLPGVDFAVDPAGLFQFLHFHYINEPTTAARDVRKLPPGASLEIGDGLDAPRITQWASWDDFDLSFSTHDEVIEAVRARLSVAIRQMCRSDIPIAVALSAGVDSGAVAALAAREHGPENLLAVSVGFEGRPAFDERADAEALARRLGVEFESVEVSVSTIAEDYPAVLEKVDDLLGELAVYGYYSVARASAERGRRVLLSGVGGDELFWGYDNLDAAVSRQRAVDAGWRPDDSLRARLSRTGRTLHRQLNPTVKWRAEDWTPPPGYSSFMENAAAVHTVQSALPSLLRRDADRAALDHVFAGHDRWRAGEERPHEAVLRNLIETWFVGNSLSLSDRVGMASSVETRLPLLDVGLAEIVFSARRSLEDYSIGRKHWLRRACADILPESVLHRRKTGFTFPYHTLVGDVVDRWRDRLLDGPLTDIFDRDKLARLKGPLDFHRKFLMFKLISASLWCERAADAASPSEGRSSLT